MKRRPRLPQVLPLPEPLRVLDAAPRPRRQPALHLRRLGGRRGLLVLAGRVLVRARHARPARARRPSSTTGSATSGFLIAMFLVFSKTGTLDYTAIFAHRRCCRPGRPHGHLPAALPRPPPASRPRSRCSPGWPTPWRARRRSRPSSTPPPWSPPGVYLMCRINPLLAAVARRRAGGGDRSARSPRSWPRPSPAPSRTSRRCSPTRRSPSSATCSWPSAPAPTWPPSSSWSPTPSTRRCSSSGPAR